MASSPIILRKPFYTSVNHRVNVYFFQDGSRKKAQDMTGKTLTAKAKDAGGSTVTYSLTGTNLTLGRAYFTTTGASHTTVGKIEFQILADGVPRERYEGTVVASL